MKGSAQLRGCSWRMISHLIALVLFRRGPRSKEGKNEPIDGESNLTACQQQAIVDFPVIALIPECKSHFTCLSFLLRHRVTTLLSTM